MSRLIVSDIVGAHLDSWDLGTGATDNGTGVAAVLEAALALSKSSVRPKRTIRAYVKSHQSELWNISAVLVHDSGTGQVVSIDLEGDYAAREVMDGVVESMHDLGLVEPPSALYSAVMTSLFMKPACPVSLRCKIRSITQKRTICWPIRSTMCARKISSRVRRCWRSGRITSLNCRV
jgi:hypothetical protein